mmetsp:Transcript_25183/g.57919  ORF Transcript_25183/g.57919 Transcript_25183/m.57919 type:complete len:238 (-) Transcript_25183:2076-2789(-)
MHCQAESLQLQLKMMEGHARLHQMLLQTPPVAALQMVHLHAGKLWAEDACLQHPSGRSGGWAVASSVPASGLHWPSCPPLALPSLQDDVLVDASWLEGSSAAPLLQLAARAPACVCRLCFYPSLCASFYFLLGLVALDAGLGGQDTAEGRALAGQPLVWHNWVVRTSAPQKRHQNQFDVVCFVFPLQLTLQSSAWVCHVDRCSPAFPAVTVPWYRQSSPSSLTRMRHQMSAYRSASL